MPLDCSQTRLRWRCARRGRVKLMKQRFPGDAAGARRHTHTTRSVLRALPRSVGDEQNVIACLRSQSLKIEVHLRHLSRGECVGAPKARPSSTGIAVDPATSCTEIANPLGQCAV